MYTEIRELVNFLARYFHLRIPRLKIGMFCEHMANNCLFRFQPYWNINQPKQHEEKRIIRISRAFCDETFTTAADFVGVLLEELLNCLPGQLILYVNPGEVFYCSCDYSPPVPIWLGSVNEDLIYNETQQKSANSMIPPQPLPSSILPPMFSPIQPLMSSLFSQQAARANQHPASSGPRNGLFGAGIALKDSSSADFSLIDWRISLSLVHPRELGYESTNPYSGFLMFRYVIPGATSFTVETFASTRFGSFRKRPDHEKKFVEAIKYFVNNSEATTSAESHSATTTASGSGGDIRGGGGGIWSSNGEGGVWNFF